MLPSLLSSGTVQLPFSLGIPLVFAQRVPNSARACSYL